MSDRLRKNILSTIVYYDILDYPLTAFEVWKYLITEKISDGASGKSGKFSLGDICNELEKNRGAYWEENRGFYFLKNREKLVRQRIRREKISQKKIRRVRKLVFWLKFCPYVRMVTITGRVAMKNAESGSDLDLLVVFRKGRIFTGRLFFTLFSHFLGKRRHGEKIRNRACLNYFVTDASLEIILKDLFSSSEYFFALPVFGRKVFGKFQEKNRWIQNFRSNYALFEGGGSLWVRDTGFSRLARTSFEKILDFDALEKFLASWQLRKIKNNPKTSQKGSAVMANEKMLVFLPKPRGPEIFEKYCRKMESLKGL